MEACGSAHTRALTLDAANRWQLQVRLVHWRRRASAGGGRDEPIGGPRWRRQQVLLVRREKVLEGALALVQRLHFAVSALQHLVHRQIHQVVGSTVELGFAKGVAPATSVLLLVSRRAVAAVAHGLVVRA